MLGPKLARAADSGWFSYLTIFLLQLKIIWGVWRYKDLTWSDTSYYFLSAYDWYENSHVLITWSPLYTSFYGTLLHLSSDAYVVTILHRVLIVLALAMLVLALMRRVLPAGFAWVATAWWVVLPNDFDALYEIHLFALIPVVLSFLVILWKPGPWGRGMGVAILFASTFLVRNELMLATILLAVLSLGWELLCLRKGARRPFDLGRAYGLPLIAACLLILFYCSRSTDLRIIGPMLERKHTLNLCETFAFDYQQRHSDWQGSPWTECESLMTRVYGVPEPSMAEALKRNPSAMLGHFWSNIQLIPSGLQVLLFDSMSGVISPDYVSVKRSRRAVLYTYSLAICVVVIRGLYLLIRERDYWWKCWLRERIWAWTAMGCVACVAGVIMVTQRPRPSYLFAFGIALRAAILMCAWIASRQWSQIRHLAAALPVAIVALILCLPLHYTAVSANRPLRESYRRLAPFEDLVRRSNTGLVALDWADELCNYVGKSVGRAGDWALIMHQPQHCRPLPLTVLRQQVTRDMPFHSVLDKNRATLLFASDALFSDPEARRYLQDAKSHGWRTITMQHDSKYNWELLENVAVSPTTPGGVADTGDLDGAATPNKIGAPVRDP